MKWVSVWGNAASVTERRPETYAKNISLRYPVVSAFGGDKIRLFFSDFCGTDGVKFDRVTVAHSVSDREIDVKDAAIVTFGGRESGVCAAGEEIYSDEIAFTVKPREKITVTIYLKGFTDMHTGVVAHGPLSKGFYSEGDCTFTPVLPLARTRTTDVFYFLSGIDVFTDDRNRAVILYGDSITAGSWADRLAEIYMDDAFNRTAVIRRAASGTRVLREYDCLTYQSYGLKGERRFDREIASVAGAEAVVVQQGINDIIHPVGTEINPFRPMSDLPTVRELEEGIERYISSAKRSGLKCYAGTLLPIYGWRTYAPFREQMRTEFNDWVRSLKHIDGCIDFDRAVRDKRNPSRFAEGYDSGDHLHPSEQAYEKMAQPAAAAIGR